MAISMFLACFFHFWAHNFMKRSLDGLASKGYYLSDHLSVLVLDMYVCQTYFNETSLSSYKFFDGMFALPFFLHKVGLLDLMMQRRSLRDIVTLETAQKNSIIDYAAPSLRIHTPTTVSLKPSCRLACMALMLCGVACISFTAIS